MYIFHETLLPEVAREASSIFAGLVFFFASSVSPRKRKVGKLVVGVGRVKSSGIQAAALFFFSSSSDLKGPPSQRERKFLEKNSASVSQFFFFNIACLVISCPVHCKTHLLVILRNDHTSLSRGSLGSLREVLVTMDAFRSSADETMDWRKSLSVRDSP